MKLTTPLLLLVAAMLWALPARAAMPAVPDTGVYHVYVDDQALGIESFSFNAGRDSLFLQSHALQTFPAQSGTDTLDKFVQMIIGHVDQDLHFYQSTQRFRGVRLTRGLSLSDTVYTAYREDDRGGVGETRVRPPGKIYVIDVQSFMVFDLLCRNFHEKKFKKRRINLLVLGARDSVVEASVEDLGTETIRWGHRPIEARKLRVSDQNTEFLAWVSPRGYMLRLHQPTSRLRVERAAPKIRGAGSGGR